MKFNYRKWWSGLTVGQQDAYLNKLEADLGGGENKAGELLEAYLRGEYKVVLQDTNPKLVDIHGRIIPVELNGKVVDANYNFHLTQPELFCGQILARLRQFFDPQLEWMSAEDFSRQCGEIFASIESNKQTKNLLKGVHLPICFPKIIASDYGRSLEEVFLVAVARSYQDAFPKRQFHNNRSGDLAGMVSIAENTRHERLVAAMAKGSVTGVWFPTALHGFGIQADREAIRVLPDNYLLSGAIDASMAMVAFSQVLARDYNTPGLDCAANSWGSVTLSFRASDGHLIFGHGGLGAGDVYSAGVLVLGQ